eukprot:830351_1
MSTLAFYLALIYLLNHIQCATIMLDNTTSDYVWDLEILLFAEQNPGPFAMHDGGTISIDITSTKLLNIKDQECPKINNIFYLEIYILNEEEFSIINNDDYKSLNCYDVTSGSFQK